MLLLLVLLGFISIPKIRGSTRALPRFLIVPPPRRSRGSLGRRRTAVTATAGRSPSRTSAREAVLAQLAAPVQGAAGAFLAQEQGARPGFDGGGCHERASHGPWPTGRPASPTGWRIQGADLGTASGWPHPIVAPANWSWQFIRLEDTYQWLPIDLRRQRGEQNRSMRK